MTTKPQTALNNSTIVRPKYSIILELMRSGFGVLERFAPALGARWAERLWFTRPRLPAAARRSGIGLPPGTGFDVNVNGANVRGLSWGAGPNVYLVHGWGGWGLQLAAFVAPLIAVGYRVVTFDMPSHGASDPGKLGARASTLVEFAEALQAVVAAQGPAHALIAHSLGATAAAIALRDGITAPVAVFIAPMADAVHYTHGFARVLGFGERIRSRLQRRIERRVGLPMAYFNVPRMAHDMRTPPLLVIHDRDDRETAWSDGQSIAAAWPQARLLSTQGLGHRRIVSDTHVISAALHFIQAQAAKSVPSLRITQPLRRVEKASRAPAYATLLTVLIAGAIFAGVSDVQAQEGDAPKTEVAQTETKPLAVGPTEDAPTDAELQAQLRAEQRKMRDHLRGLANISVAPAGM